MCKHFLCAYSGAKIIKIELVFQRYDHVFMAHGVLVYLLTYISVLPNCLPQPQEKVTLGFCREMRRRLRRKMDVILFGARQQRLALPVADGGGGGHGVILSSSAMTEEVVTERDAGE